MLASGQITADGLCTAEQLFSGPMVGRLMDELAAESVHFTTTEL
jgi:hypothetical protein